MTPSPGQTLREVRERKPLVHQITNYVVMNETANATLALGALPVMAHAREEVEEMVALAGALVLNIGTLSPHWVEAMLLAGRAANEHGVPVVLDKIGVAGCDQRQCHGAGVGHVGCGVEPIFEKEEGAERKGRGLSLSKKVDCQK